MRCRLVIGAVLASAVLLCGRLGLAEDNVDRPKESSTPILDRLGDFGRKIFGPRQDDRERPKQAKSSSSSSRPKSEEEPSPNRPSDRVYMPRAGSASGATARPGNEPSATTSLFTGPASPGPEAGASARRFVRSSPQEEPVPGSPAPDAGVSARRFVRSDQQEEPAEERQADKAVPPVSGLVPIHERLANFRQSLFGKSGGAENPVDAKNAPAAGAKPDQAAIDAGARSGGDAPVEQPRATRVLVERPAAEARGAAGDTVRERAVALPAGNLPGPESRAVATPSDRTARPETRGPESVPSVHPTPANPNPSLELSAAPPAERAAEGIGPRPAASSSAPPAEVANPPVVEASSSPVRGSEPASQSRAIAASKGDEPSRSPATGGASGPAVFSTESPAVSVETSGPRRIVVGKEGTYEVIVRNRSAVAAEQVVVSVDLPQWTEVSGADTTAGTAATGRATTQPGQIRWSLLRLEPQRVEKLTLRIVPRQSRPFDLVARVDYSPPKSQATIEVQEARLGIALYGPREIVYGRAEVYKLELSNTGTADAENVMVTLAPSTPGEKLAAATRRFGTLPAGQKKTVAMEVTARQDGNLSIAVDVRADGGVKAQLAQEIMVRRVKLAADVAGPKMVFSGNEVTYRIRVRNQGSAPANQVKVQAILPKGAKYLSSSQNARLMPNEPKVLWTIERIGVGAEAVFSLTCAMSGSGPSRLDVRCDADGDALASTSAVTQVETVASLALTVEEPSGPVGLEGEAAYQIRVQNRGTAGAKDVEVVVYFANNLEPVSAEGARHRLGAGQVVFEPLPALAAGEAVTFQVKAKAAAAGNHVFRVEVRCAATDVRLVREGTTRFYAADGSGDPPALAQPVNKEAAGSANESRTADRRDAVPPQTDPQSSGRTQR